MGRVIIQEETEKFPISLIGKEAGVCWGGNTADRARNYKRGLGCIRDGHGRTMEYPQIYMILDGYSARVIRELYTHIAGGPTRLQASTRYIDYQSGFDFITPPSIGNDPEAKKVYEEAMHGILENLQKLEAMGVPREDNALLLPLGMTTKVVLRTNLRNLADMSHQRLCTRAYWEYREMMRDIIDALNAYGENEGENEWKKASELLFMPKCDVTGFCTESKCCGRRPKKED